MSRGTAALSKVSKALAKVAPLNRLVYKRITSNQGDSLIGKVTSETFDTLLTPQPAIFQIGRDHLSGARDPVETVLNPSGDRQVKDDYTLTISGDAISDSELSNGNLQFVIKAVTGEEVLYIMDYSPLELQGTIIAYEIYARSVKV